MKKILNLVLFVQLFGLISVGNVFAEDVRPDMVVADFNGSDYGAWTATGEAFGAGPAHGTLPNQMEVSGFEGAGLVNSYVGGDVTTGTLKSPEFKIERPYINFLVGGGKDEALLGMRLIIDGQTVRHVTGLNDRPGGSERLEMASWDVSEFVGKIATLEIYDNATGGWGHINIDNIVQSDVKKAVSPADKIRTIVLDKGYLIVPISNNGSKCTMTISVDGILLHKLNVALADSKDSTDWYAYLEVLESVGKTATIEVNELRYNSDALKRIRTADAGEIDSINVTPRYTESVRPQLHFSQKQGWNNDVNGMVYLNGKYHLFWQSNPVGLMWDNMYWGHAVSSDLIHWTEKPVAFRPFGGDTTLDKRYSSMTKGQCFSGSANVLRDNSDESKSTIIATLTDTGCGEALGISRDEGVTWTYQPFNPIISHNGRDPKLVWYKPGQYWVIAVYDESEGRKIAFYKSTDLKSWTKTGQIDGFFECPELFEIPVEGTNESKWVLMAANAEYVVGQFNGQTFIPDTVNADGSVCKERCFDGFIYAAQCFSNAPDGRVILMGWTLTNYGYMTNGIPFNHGFTVPLELSLKSTPDGIRLFAYPVKEFNQLRTEKKELKATLRSGEEKLRVASYENAFPTEHTELHGNTRNNIRITPCISVNSVVNKCGDTPLASNLYDVEFRFKPTNNGTVTLTMGTAKLIYHCSEHRFEGLLAADQNMDPGVRQPLPIVIHPTSDGFVTVRIILDRSCVETIYNGGQHYRINAYDWKNSFDSVTVTVDGTGQTVPVELNVWTLKSIWK